MKAYTPEQLRIEVINFLKGPTVSNVEKYEYRVCLENFLKHLTGTRFYELPTSTYPPVKENAN